MGYISFQDDMDTAIAIRTAVLKDGTLYAQAGGGIVHDSVPESRMAAKRRTRRARSSRAADMVQQGLDTEDLTLLLMIDNYDSFTYNLVQYFGELGADVHVHRNDVITLEQIAALGTGADRDLAGPVHPRRGGDLGSA